MNCCSRKTVTSQSKPVLRPNETEIRTIGELVETLEVDLIPLEELRAKKAQVLDKPEWKTQSRNQMANLLKETQAFATLLTDQIDVLSRGLKAELIINTHIEDYLSKDLKSTRLRS